MKVIAIDFETANGDPSSVCAVGICSFEGDRVEEYGTLIRPFEDVSYFDPYNIRIHGIHPEDTITAPAFREVYRRMIPYLTDGIVCAHNAMFDMGCLRAACRKSSLVIPPIEYFDTVSLAKRMAPELKHHRLNDMCNLYAIPLNHHNAASDAYGCAGIVMEAMRRSGCSDIREVLAYYGVRTRFLYYY